MFLYIFYGLYARPALAGFSLPVCLLILNFYFATLTLNRFVGRSLELRPSFSQLCWFLQEPSIALTALTALSQCLEMELIAEKMHKEDEREAKEAALLELEELKECTFYQEFFENIRWLVRVISP